MTIRKVTNRSSTITVNSGAVSDSDNTSTGAFDLPAGTTVQRPGSPNSGQTRFNTETGSLEFYDGNAWIQTNLVPNITSITGEINNTYGTSLVFAVTSNTATVDVLFAESGSVFHTLQSVTVTNGAFTITVPSQVYGQTAGDTIGISIRNTDGTLSDNTITKTVLAAPTGGTIVVSGGKRYHTFTSSSNFVTGANWPSTTVEYLYVAGGGGGSGDLGGGGGAGGHVTGNFTTTANSTYAAEVGGGGAGGAGIRSASSSGVDGNQSRLTLSGSTVGTAAVGGGTSGHYNDGSTTHGTGHAGGSGGGAGASDASRNGGAGTSGQGNAGGAGGYAPYYHGGGGGGAGAAGASANGTTIAGIGGVGTTTYDAWGAATSTGENVSGTRYFSGGGGGGSYNANSVTGFADGGHGGGGEGWGNSNLATAGTANTGGGGGGGGYNHGGPSPTAGAAGGSGIVILRYDT